MRRTRRTVPLLAATLVLGGVAFGAQTAMAGKEDPCQPCFNDPECDFCCFITYGTGGVCFEAHQACLCF